MNRNTTPTSGRGLAIAATVATAVIFAGCAAPPAPRTYSALPAPVVQTDLHHYSVSAVDARGQPLPGVQIEVSLEAKGTAPVQKSCQTDEHGACEKWEFVVNKDPTYSNIITYSSTAKATGNKTGYYTATDSGYFFSGASLGLNRGRSELKLRMIAPADFLDDDFATSAADRDLRERVMRFLEVIKLQSILSDSEVMLKGVGTSEFKGKKYLRLRINSTTTFNSLKLNKYDMGKRLYDDTVRKVLTPLNENIAAPKAYFGYDIVVYGHTKSFAEESAAATKVEYRFLLPEAAVRRYKDKDITGQALLDAGVELMDDERVEFKLQ